VQASIFIPQPIPEKAVEQLKGIGTVEMFPHLDRAISREELVEAVPGKTILLALGGIPYDREVLAAATKLRLIASMQNRLAKFVDLQAATERGVIVTGTPAAVTPTPVAELAMAMVLGLAWRLLEADRFTREGRWRQNQSMAIITTGLEGKQIGIFGLGAIGMAVARRARSFGMRVSYHKRSRLDPEQERTLGVQWRSVDELFRESDFVVLSAPLTEETRGLVNAHRLSTMKPSSFLINVSRGAVVVEDDLVHALREGVIAGAGLDVHQHEPPAPNAGPHRDLCKMPNVLLTPHIGSATREAREAKAQAVVENVAAFLRGERPPHVLNPEVYERSVALGG
jgi:glyoxylate reductase